LCFSIPEKKRTQIRSSQELLAKKRSRDQVTLLGEQSKLSLAAAVAPGLPLAWKPKPIRQACVIPAHTPGHRTASFPRQHILTTIGVPRSAGLPNTLPLQDFFQFIHAMGIVFQAQ